MTTEQNKMLRDTLEEIAFLFLITENKIARDKFYMYNSYKDKKVKVKTRNGKHLNLYGRIGFKKIMNLNDELLYEFIKKMKDKHDDKIFTITSINSENCDNIFYDLAIKDEDAIHIKQWSIFMDHNEAKKVIEFFSI